MKFRPDQPWNDLPLPPRAEVETRAVLKASIEGFQAHTKLGQCKNLRSRGPGQQRQAARTGPRVLDEVFQEGERRLFAGQIWRGPYCVS